MDSFLETCGATGPVLLKFEDRKGSRIEQQVFHQPYILIGRNPRADLHLNDVAISTRHAFLQMVAGRFYYIDLESRTGTSLEGKPERVCWVDPERTIQIGPFRFRAKASGSANVVGSGRSVDWPSPLSTQFTEQFPLPEASLEIARGGARFKSRPLSRALTLIGRAPICKIRLPDPECSRFYCALLRTPSGVWFVDLLASEGVLVNGASARHVRLADGDELRIGRFVLRLRYGVPPLDDRRLDPARWDAARPGPIAHPSPGIPSISLPHAAVPFAYGPPEVSLRPVLDQLAQMQQQMSDQFKQMMGMLPQIITLLHKNHVELIRDELAEMVRLTHEIRAVREATDHGPPSSTIGPPSDGADARAAPPHALRHIAVGKSSGHADLPSGERRAVRDPKEIQEVVSERLASFERERQGSWDKILKILMG